MIKQQAIIQTSVKGQVPMLVYSNDADYVPVLSNTWREITYLGSVDYEAGFPLIMGIRRAPKDGIYEINFNGAVYTSSNTGLIEVGIGINGSTPLFRNLLKFEAFNNVNNAVPFSKTMLIDLNVNDFVSIWYRRINNVLPNETITFTNNAFSIKLID